MQYRQRQPKSLAFCALPGVLKPKGKTVLPEETAQLQIPILKHYSIIAKVFTNCSGTFRLDGGKGSNPLILELACILLKGSKQGATVKPVQLITFD